MIYIHKDVSKPKDAIRISSEKDIPKELKNNISIEGNKIKCLSAEGYQYGPIGSVIGIDRKADTKTGLGTWPLGKDSYEERDGKFYPAKEIRTAEFITGPKEITNEWGTETLAPGKKGFLVTTKAGSKNILSFGTSSIEQYIVCDKNGNDQMKLSDYIKKNALDESIGKYRVGQRLQVVCESIDENGKAKFRVVNESDYNSRDIESKFVDEFGDTCVSGENKSWRVAIKEAFQKYGLTAKLSKITGDGTGGLNGFSRDWNDHFDVYFGDELIGEFRCRLLRMYQGNIIELFATTRMKKNQNAMWKYNAAIRGAQSMDGLKTEVDFKSSDFNAFAKKYRKYKDDFDKNNADFETFKNTYLGKQLNGQIINNIYFDPGNGYTKLPKFLVSSSIGYSPITRKWYQRGSNKDIEIDNPFNE